MTGDGEENLFLYALRFSDWGVRIKLAKNRLIGKRINFNSHTHRKHTEKCDSKDSSTLGLILHLNIRGGEGEKGHLYEIKWLLPWPGGLAG